MVDVRRCRLRDGTLVHLRPIEADDKQRLADGLAHLSPESRYRRFLTATPRLSSSQLRYLTEVDHDAHEALLALDPSQASEPALGVARYVRLPDAPDVAEFAVVVVDDHQGRGLGTLLLAALARAAAAHGIARLRGWVSASNEPMLRLLRGLGAEVVADEPHVLRADLSLGPDALPATPTAQAFRAAAATLAAAEAGSD